MIRWLGVTLKSGAEQMGIITRGLYNLFRITIRALLRGEDTATAAGRTVAFYQKKLNEARAKGREALIEYELEEMDRFWLDWDARRQRIESRRAKPTPRTSFEAGEEMGKFKPLESDALIRVGNFLGTNRGILESLANRQVQLLVSIERNTKKVADKADRTTEGDGYPED